MNPISRRALLATTAALAAGPVRAEPARRLTIERRTLSVNGKPADTFAIRQPDGTAGLVLEPGQRFTVALANAAGEPSIVHWHGQTPPVRQDGVADLGLEPLIADGDSASYDYVPRPGTYWMHSHHGMQEQRLMAAPLVVRSAEDARLDAQEVIVLLQDFSFRTPARILAGLTGMAGMGKGMDMGHAAADPPGMLMDLNDVDYDAYLANDRTLDDPLLVRAERNGRVRLRLINGASATAFWIDLGGLDGEVIAVDGDAVRPVPVRRLPLAEAQRADILLRLPADGGAWPVLAQREGDRARTGFILATPGASVRRLSGVAERPVPAADLSLERRLSARAPLSARPADVVLRVTLDGQMTPFRWSLNGRGFAERVKLLVGEGQRVELDLVNTTPMAHPMHLHGHRFQVVGIDGTDIAGALRDTVLVPAKGRVRVAFDADNPGRWLFHCHNLYHMETGMMTEVAYRGFV